MFKGTRVPVKTFFEYLEDNYTLDEFLDCLPAVTREMARREAALSASPKPGTVREMSAFADALRTVRTLLAKNAGAEAVADDDDLLEMGLLDSVGVLGLVAEIEKTFGLRVETRHLTEANFRSLRAIADLVQRLAAEKTAP